MILAKYYSCLVINEKSNIVYKSFTGLMIAEGTYYFILLMFFENVGLGFKR